MAAVAKTKETIEQDADTRAYLIKRGYIRSHTAEDKLEEIRFPENCLRLDSAPLPLIGRLPPRWL